MNSSLKAKIVEILREVAKENVLEDHMASDYCGYCYEDYGNVQKFYVDKGLKVPHKESCLMLLAREVLEELENGERLSNT